MSGQVLKFLTGRHLAQKNAGQVDHLVLYLRMCLEEILCQILMETLSWQIFRLDREM